MDECTLAEWFVGAAIIATTCVGGALAVIGLLGLFGGNGVSKDGVRMLAMGLLLGSIAPAAYYAGAPIMREVQCSGGGIGNLLPDSWKGVDPG